MLCLAAAGTARDLFSRLGWLLGGLARCRPPRVFFSPARRLVEHESRVDIWRKMVIRWDGGIPLKVLDVLCIKYSSAEPLAESM